MTSETIVYYMLGVTAPFALLAITLGLLKVLAKVGL
jgi:hypothetical protein